MGRVAVVAVDEDGLWTYLNDRHRVELTAVGQNPRQLGQVPLAFGALLKEIFYPFNGGGRQLGRKRLRLGGGFRTLFEVR